jgi:hypothetical protein
MIEFIAVTAAIVLAAVVGYAIGKHGYLSTITSIEAELKKVEATATADVKSLIAAIRSKF